MKKRRTPDGPRTKLVIELVEDRLPPGASLGGLLGIALSCACIAAIDETSAEAALASPDEVQAVPEVDDSPVLVSSSAGPAVATPGLNDMGFLLALAELEQDKDQDRAPAPLPAPGQAEQGEVSAPQPPAPVVGVQAAAPGGGTDLWDAALSDDGDPASADEDSEIPVPQANSAPTTSGGALPSGGGGGGGAPAPDTAATAPVVVASAATTIAAADDASAAPSTNNSVAFVANGNDPNLDDPGDFGSGLPATGGGKGKSLSAALSTFLQETTGTKSNYVTGVPDPGALGPDATSVIDYNYGDTYFTFPDIPFNGTTNPGAALTTTAITKANPNPPLQGAEFQGEITYPTNLSGGPHPLIIILHGRHSSAYNPATNATVGGWPPPAGDLEIPSYQGYEYLAPVLASYGFIVDSIGADAINAFDANTSDDGMLARAQLVMDQLNLWNQLDNTTTEPTAQAGYAQPGLAGKFTGTVNLQDVGLMGHSRGGEGVVEAYDLNQQMGSPYGIKAVYALAPVDFQRLTDMNVPFAVMLPYSDGDVSDLQGMHFFDDQSLLSADNSAPEYEFLVMGADHDLFNSVWTAGLFPAGAADNWAGTTATGTSTSATRGADPYAGVEPNPNPGVAPFPGAIAGATFPLITDPERLQPQAQEAANTVYESAFFQMYLQGQTQYQPILDGDAAPPASLTTLAVGEAPAIVYATYQPPDNPAVRLDLNDTLSPANLTVNALGGNVTEGGLLTYQMAGNGTIPGETSLVMPNQSSSMQPDSVPSSLAPTTGGLSQLVLDWNSTSAYWENDLPAADENVSGYSTFQFRAAVNPDDFYNDTLSENFSVALTDAEGKSVEVPVSKYTNWLFYPPGKVSPLPKLINQGIRIPLSAFVGIDLTQITSVRFNFDQTPSGGLTFTELAFADASPTGKITTTSTTS